MVVEGYRGEPYLRFLPDGTVQVNRRSPAAYLNEDRFAQVEVPATRRPDARRRAGSRWRENGRYDWHDHRIHWMSKTPPQPVREDESRRVKIFDWSVPVVGGRAAARRSGHAHLARQGRRRVPAGRGDLAGGRACWPERRSWRSSAAAGGPPRGWSEAW